jgi:ribonuclease HII
MRYPSLREEKKLWKKGYKVVVGLDEAGRGPLAGPVVAAAVYIIPNSELQIPKLRDSKKLTPRKREEFFRLIVKNHNIKWGIGKVSEKVIDKINIFEATKLAMKRAIKSLERKLKRKANFLILDGNFKIDLKIPQKSIIKGDEKVLSCAIASIIAKVTRDKIMEKYAKKFPEYGFEKHKGYAHKISFEHVKKVWSL